MKTKTSGRLILLIAILMLSLLMNGAAAEPSGPGRAASGPTSDLADLLDSVVITGAQQNDQGQYVIVEGVPYTIQMDFSEKINGAQFDETQPLTYAFPEGISPQSASGTVEMEGDGGIVRFDYVISENALTVTFDPSSPGYSSFITSETARFEIHITGVISSAVIAFSDSVSGKYDIDDEREVRVQKVGSYDGGLNKVRFTIQATAKGNNSDVHIGDIISGTALTYDPSSLTVSSDKSDPVQYSLDPRPGETFGLTLPAMAHGETVTIEYYADVDLDGVTGTGTFDETANSVSISSEEDGPGDDITISGPDLENKISLSTISKAASSQTVRDGKTYVTWTIVLNENANISLAGKSITDTIDDASQQYMRYSGSGIHIEKYHKDGSSAGGGDIRWGANGLTQSAGGSTWTYTIPASDTENYKYVITYETEVDSDAFLTATQVGNGAHNEYGSAYGGESIGTTGDEVEAEKSVVHSVVDSENKTAETEWQITFTVPAAGLQSAVVTDSLPGRYDPSAGRFYYDAYKQGSVRVGEGDLQEGEGFSVDPDPQSHKVVITFTKNNGESGLAATGLPRTIHVYLTTIADHDWLVYAESHIEARIHENDAVVTVNGQDINVVGQVSYNTTDMDLEKKLDSKYETNDTDPALPIYVYKILLTGVNDAAFDAEGYLTITDLYDAEYLVYRPEYATDHTWEVNLSNGKVYGNNQYNKYGTTGIGVNVVDGSSAEGELVFKLHRDTLPMLLGSYYPYYTICYALQIRDTETLARMREQALHSNGLSVGLENTARSDQFGTTTITTEYSVKALEKTLVSESDNDATGTHDLVFSLSVNEDGLKIGDGDTITVKDTLSSLSFDYTSIVVEPQLPGDVLDRSGYSIIFTLHNEQPYTITYTTRLIGIHDVHWHNRAELFGYTSGLSGDSSSEHGGSGSYQIYTMNVKKYAEGNMNMGLPAAFELYEARVRDANGNEIAEPQWKKVHAFTTEAETGVYQISHVLREGANEEQSLRPYSYHDADGTERFGTGESYGWRYRIVETAVPAGYLKTNVVYEFGISDIPSYIAPYNYLNGDTVTIPNTPLVTNVDTVIRGVKVLKGKALKAGEFTFVLSPEQGAEAAWGDGYPGGFSGSMKAQNGEDGTFAFALSFTYDDYLNALQKGFVGEDGAAYFYYVVREQVPQGAQDNIWNGIQYDSARFLVRVKLTFDESGATAETRTYPYDGHGIPEHLRPVPGV